MILLHRHSIATSVRDRYATTVYSFDFENINQDGSNELKFEITIDTEAFISKFEANIDGETFIGKTKEKETASKEYSEAKEKNENAILISKPYDDIPNVFQIKTNIDSKSKISLDIAIEQYITKQFDANQLNIQILRNFTKYNIIQNFEYIALKVEIADKSGIYDVSIPTPHEGMSMEHRTIDKLNQHYTAEGKIMKQNSINELMISYKIKGEQNESMVLYDAKSHTFCHVISDIITDSVIKNEQDMNEGDMDRNILIPRRVVFVIDKSGSMSGGKWTKTISATITAIKQLRKGYDRYCVLFFNSNVTSVPMDDIVLATEDNISKTITVLKGTSPSGSTNINTPLLHAIERIKEDIKSWHDAPQDGYNFYMNQILLITDGEPCSGERDPHKIISNVKNANHLKDIDPHTSKISIFSFGVGTDSNDSSWIKDLNHSFLKLLSVNNNGFYQRIKSSHTDTALTAYFNILSTPVLFNIDVQYNHKNIEQLSNTTFHTLYAGNDIIICGKMDAGDDTPKQLCLDLTITATTAKTMRTANGDRCTKPVDICKHMKVNIEMETHDDPQGNDNHIERIWAYLKLQEFAKTKLIYNDLIEVSEDEKRNDDALPLSLAMKYKFVTPWTSMIVVKKKEEEPQVAKVQVVSVDGQQGHQPPYIPKQVSNVDCSYFDSIDDEQDLQPSSQISQQNHFWGYTFKRADAAAFKQYAAPPPPPGVSKDTYEKVQAMKKRVESSISGRISDVNQRRLRSLRIEHKLKSNESDSKSSVEKAAQRAAESQDDKRQLQIQQFLDEALSWRAQRTAKKKIKRSDFKVVKVIAKGAFGEVRIVRHKEDNAKVFVMETMLKKLMIAKHSVARPMTQRDKMSSGESKWLVKLYYSFQDASHLYVVMEYCAGGNLMSLLVKWDVLTEKQTRFYMAELNEAIHAIHELDFVYRDLKPSRILITESGHIKLSDVTIRQKFRTKNDELIEKYQTKGDALTDEVMDQHSTVGAVVMDYFAPEVFSQKGYGEMIDYWSMGVIMLECLIGYVPFHASNPLQTCRKIVHYRKHFKIPDDVKLSKECIDLVRNLVCSHRRRFGYDQIKKHMFFKKQ